MKCKNCGAELGDVAFCPYCGASQTNDQFKPEQTVETKPVEGEVSEKPKSVYYNPYATGNSNIGTDKRIVGSDGVSRKKKRRHVGCTLAWIFMSIGVFLFILGIIITRLSIASLDNLNATAIVFLIMGGWVFLLIGGVSGVGGMLICGLFIGIAVISTLIEVIVYKGKSAYSWVTFGISIAVAAAFIVLVTGTSLIENIYSTPSTT